MTAMSSLPKAAPINLNQQLVSRADYLITGLIVITVIFTLPRAYARFTRGSEWFQGLFFYSVAPRRSSNPVRNPNPLTSDASESKDFDTEPSFAAVPYSGMVNDSTNSSEKELPSSVSSRSAPFRLLNILHPVTSSLRYRVHDNYSVGQVFAMLIYTGIVFYMAFYQANPFTDSERAGWVVASQFPFVYAFASKNNIVGMIAGVGYEKLNFFHRLIGRLMVFGANVHFLGFIYKWSLTDAVRENLIKPSNQWGLVALLCLDMLAFFSISAIRARSYNFFFSTHVVGLVLCLVGACLHKPACIPYVAAASGIYGIDHIVRIIKTRVTTATLRSLPELGITRVEVPSVNAGWRVGQHVRLRVLSSSMGLWGWTESHPFTIASATHTSEGMVLMCKKSGRWTNNLFKMAQKSSYGESAGRRATVWIEGPYGGVGHVVMSSYSGAMFVAGGSGVTFALAAAQELIHAGGDVKVVDIVWSIQDAASLSPLVDELVSMLEQGTDVRVHIHVFYTRAVTSKSDGMVLPRGIALVPGRPRLNKLLDAVIMDTVSAGGTNGVFVGVCGPVALAQKAVDVVNGVDARMRTSVGGVDLHEETFGW